MMMHTGDTNKTVKPPDASVSPGWGTATDSSGHVWRAVSPSRVVRYVQNRGTGMVYVAISPTVASDGVGAALLPGAAPDYVGGVYTFAPGEGEKAISAWTTVGGKIGYGE